MELAVSCHSQELQGPKSLEVTSFTTVSIMNGTSRLPFEVPVAYFWAFWACFMTKYVSCPCRIESAFVEEEAEGGVVLWEGSGPLTNLGLASPGSGWGAPVHYVMRKGQSSSTSC